MFFSALICLVPLAFYGALIVYYRRSWKAIPVYRPASGTRSSSRTRISVLVPARNEEKNIGNCLQSLFSQSYPKDLYQVIVIDDHSTDGTVTRVHAFRGETARPGENLYPVSNLLCLSLNAEPAGSGPVKAHKKFAIEAGIRAATGELIVTTDADCLFQPGWLQMMAGFYEQTGAKFIAAPVKITEEPQAIATKTKNGRRGAHSFLSIFQTLDFITLQGITGAAVHRKFHSMCNGANLAYEKQAFLEVGGFSGIDGIPSGDDMLLMHKIYKKYPGRVFYLKNHQAIVSTGPETTWKGFVNQRVRWASKADQYDDKRIFWVLLMVYLVNLLFAALVMASFWNSRYLWLLLVLILIKTMMEYPFVRTVAGFFDQERLMPYFPLMQPFHILYTIVIGWLGKFGSYRWKERKIKK
jgi:cellulose synthase/poly-beta-1,6-N-acetylglucosamine synthase-like glycosyltransferase